MRNGPPLVAAGTRPRCCNALLHGFGRYDEAIGPDFKEWGDKAGRERGCGDWAGHTGVRRQGCSRLVQPLGRTQQGPAPGRRYVNDVARRPDLKGSGDKAGRDCGRSGWAGLTRVRRQGWSHLYDGWRQHMFRYFREGGSPRTRETARHPPDPPGGQPSNENRKLKMFVGAADSAGTGVRAALCERRSEEARPPGSGDKAGRECGCSGWAGLARVRRQGCSRLVPPLGRP